MKINRKKLLIASVILSLSLNGCAKKGNNIPNKESNELVCEEVMNPIEQNYYSNLEYVYGFTKNNNDKYTNNISFDYLIDFSNLTDDEYDLLYERMGNTPINKATFAKLVEDKTITNIEKAFDGKIAMTPPTFYGDGTNHFHQPIIIPESYDCNNIIDFIGSNSDNNERCELNCKKFITLDGQTLYYLDGKVMNNNSILFNAKCLYEFTDNNEFILLYRNQTGVHSDDNNIQSTNLNNESDVVYPLEKTVFKDLKGVLKESFLREALDTYSGQNKVYSSDNEGIDFSKYLKP